MSHLISELGHASTDVDRSFSMEFIDGMFFRCYRELLV